MHFCDDAFISLVCLTLLCRQTAFPIVLTWVGAGLVCKSFNFMWYGAPDRLPTHFKTSAYSCNMYSFVVGKGWVLPFIVIEFLHQETCADLGPCAVFWPWLPLCALPGQSGQFWV